MRKRTFLLAMLISLVVIGAAVCGGLWYMLHSEETSPTPVVSQRQGYILGVDKGMLALFRDGESQPMQTYDLPVAMLPEYDRSMLQRGIYMETYEDAQRMVEDYTS